MTRRGMAIATGAWMLAFTVAPAAAVADRPSRFATDAQALITGETRAHTNRIVFAVRHGSRVVSRTKWGRHGRCSRVRVPVVFNSPDDYPRSAGVVFYRTCWRLHPSRIRTRYLGAALTGARESKSSWS